LLAQLGIAPSDAGYMGDDLPDLPVLGHCGFACAPPGAHQLALRRAHYVTDAPAGAGAAREVCEYVLGAQGKLESALAKYLA
jgi:3-deoxy-D-manno-octulosonate 8-phosphate phosphatase (KDO 8-P phosphatase)